MLTARSSCGSPAGARVTAAVVRDRSVVVIGSSSS
jgi:hypothetical protein